MTQGKEKDERELKQVWSKQAYGIRRVGAASDTQREMKRDDSYMMCKGKRAKDERRRNASR